MSTLVVFAGLAFCASFGTATRADAQLRTEDVIGLGIQLLLQNQQNQASQAPRSQNSQNAQTRQPNQGQSPSQTAQSQLVAETQRLLNALGYPAGTVDGAAGPQTRNAIALFQRDHGLPQTGAIDPALVSTLQSRLATGYTAPASAPFMPASGTPGTLTLLEGVDIPGGDYRSGLTELTLFQIGVESCARFCAEDAQCEAFTYNTKAGCLHPEECRRQYGTLCSGRVRREAGRQRFGAPDGHGNDRSCDATGLRDVRAHGPDV